MKLYEIKEKIKHLSIDERKSLIIFIVDSIIENTQPTEKRSLLEFEGVGAHLRDDSIDAQEYINQLRSEWDDRP